MRADVERWFARRTFTFDDRLAAIEVELDRCWDLLRQRRALRSAGADPDDAAVRDSATVEGYLQ